MITLKWLPLHNEAVLPEYQTDGAACMDIHCVLDEWTHTYIRSQQTKILRTGWAVEVPEGYELQIRMRSGLASKGLILANGVGTIDSDYRGEVGVIVTNTSPDIIRIDHGQRVAQCKLEKVIPFEFEIASLLTETERGDGGYGHTGC